MFVGESNRHPEHLFLIRTSARAPRNDPRFVVPKQSSQVEPCTVLVHIVYSVHHGETWNSASRARNIRR